MPYEKKKTYVLRMTTGEGRRTFGSFLAEIAGNHLREHREFMDRFRTPGVNEYRERMSNILNTEIKEDEAFRLGEMKDTIKEKMKTITAIVRVHKIKRRVPNREVMERVIKSYEEMLKMIKQGRRP